MKLKKQPETTYSKIYACGTAPGKLSFLSSFSSAVVTFLPEGVVDSETLHTALCNKNIKIPDPQKIPPALCTIWWVVIAKSYLRVLKL
jgi:hypothetical protein